MMSTSSGCGQECAFLIFFAEIIHENLHQFNLYHKPSKNFIFPMFPIKQIGNLHYLIS